MGAELAPGVFTPEQAREFTDDLKLDYVIVQGKIAQAFKGKIWVALGYMDWAEYITTEFGGLRIRPPKEREIEALQELNEAAMSSRDIAAAYGISHMTVQRKLEAAKRDSEPTARSGNIQETGTNVPPVTVQQTSSHRAPEDAQLVDEGEHEQPESASPRLVSNGNGRLEGGDVHGSDFGFEAFGEEPGQGALQVSEKAIRDTIRDFNGTGSADTEQIKKTAMELVSHLRSGLVPAEAWDEDELTIVAEDTMDTVSVLLDLLLAMAQPNYSNGVSRAAIADSDVRGQLSTVTQKLEALSGVINSGTLRRELPGSLT